LLPLYFDVVLRTRGGTPGGIPDEIFNNPTRHGGGQCGIRYIEHPGLSTWLQSKVAPVETYYSVDYFALGLLPAGSSAGIPQLAALRSLFHTLVAMPPQIGPAAPIFVMQDELPESHHEDPEHPSIPIHFNVL